MALSGTKSSSTVSETGVIKSVVTVVAEIWAPSTDFMNTVCVFQLYAQMNDVCNMSKVE